MGNEKQSDEKADADTDTGTDTGAGFDTDIELLEYKMERIARLKDETVTKLQSRIEAAEERANRLRDRLRWYDSYLTQLRRKRELAETGCHRELMELHNRLRNLKSRKW